jgi:formylglycine-generating enzyme required for sulfatase activity
VEFLNAKAATDFLGLFHPSMMSHAFGGIVRMGSAGSFQYAVKPGMGNKPVTFVSFQDAMRFTNWLSNGQGTGSTETGAYTFPGADPALITRNADAKWFLPSVDEWYKAAYYQPAAAGGDADSYWLYPMRSNETPTEATVSDLSYNISNPGPNVANYNLNVGNFTSVGSAGPLSASYYGTFDQGGNASEITDSIFPISTVPAPRITRGGTFRYSASYLSATSPPSAIYSGNEDYYVGFRVATIPEPSTVALAAIGLLALAGVAVRRAYHKRSAR